MHTTPNGKRYIGLTSMNIYHRWQNGKGYKKNRHFTYAIEKYGWDNIKHDILFNDLDRKSACRVEQLLIVLFRTTEQEYGYNETTGGDSAYHHSEESLKRMREAHKGHYVSAETRKKIGDANRHRVFTPEILHNMSVCQLGKHHTEETRKKMSESHKGKRNTEEHNHNISKAKMGHEVSQETREKLRKINSKPCKCIEKNIIYSSTWDAQYKTGINQSTICKVCNHRPRSNTAGGYHWEWATRQE